MSDAFITCSGLSFSWPDDTPVFRDLSCTIGGGRTGLVAANGAGKSTLLKLIAGELRPSSGAVSVRGALGHLPQHLSFPGARTVAEVLGIAEVLRALAAVESGDADEEHFATIGTDWDIEERTRAQLDRLGLGDIPFDRRLHTLSGGQIISLGLAAELLRRPEVLLLDEPTNNLDIDARHRLHAVLDDFTGCLLVVSHDRALLDRMDRTAELESGEMRTHGGNFTDYEQALHVEQQAAEKHVRSAEQQVKREKREMQQARERAARRAGSAARNVADAGLPKIVAGAMKRRAQESAGKADDVHAARLDAARAKLDEAERGLREEQQIAVDLPDTNVPAGRTVFLGERLRVRRDGRELFAGEGLDLAIRGPERIALTGPNGAGKSTLLHVISGEVEPDAGATKRVDGRIAHLSQKLELLDVDRTVAQNLAAFAPAMLEQQRIHLLARFLFQGSRIHLPVRALSGGERLRATLACVLSAEPAPQLLLLDEPTNNLDLAGVRRMESALNAYRGAFVVVSHDERFLAEIGADRWLRLAEGRLLEQ
ncbi:ABC-F family ATP-binding cassette domain-containing protein [Saccharopolyspora sp. SCSIO 74807]|uniref:ABC-F family ATP-binding cassette domain-containing protein n=1 Tax=Saccharopolyspora sp. SCSIO 74807 TaxID=3118084 RepID=UPI0030D3C19E